MPLYNEYRVALIHLYNMYNIYIDDYIDTKIVIIE